MDVAGDVFLGSIISPFLWWEYGHASEWTGWKKAQAKARLADGREMILKFDNRDADRSNMILSGCSSSVHGREPAQIVGPRAYRHYSFVEVLANGRDFQFVGTSVNSIAR
jgi:hypothetical protein